MVNMFIPCVANKYVVEEDEDKLSQKFNKHGIHQSLECHGDIGEAEWHDKPLIQALVSVEYSLKLVFWFH